MIELYTWPTPNGWKVHIALEEMGMPYNTHPVDILSGIQKEPDFQKLNPNGRIPAIVDTDVDLTLFESGAIMIHLAEKSGLFLPTDVCGRAEVIQWVTNDGAGEYFFALFPRKNPCSNRAFPRRG
jgi:GST-like protein